MNTEDPAESLNLLRGLCLACSCINRLIKTHHFLASDDGEFNQAFRLALDQLVDEGFIDPSRMGLGPPP